MTDNDAFGPKIQNVSRPMFKFTPELNMGHIIQAAVVAAGFFGWIWAQGGAQSRAQVIEELSRTALQTEMRTLRETVQTDLKLTKDALSTLETRVATVQSSDAIQTDRINNLSLAATEYRSANTETIRQLASVREVLAAIQARLGINRETRGQP